MNVIPSIDIMDNQCVRLKRGDYAAVTAYARSPAEMATLFHNEGATVLHVVDLLGAKHGAITTWDTLEDIVRAFKGTVQVGGGVRTEEEVQRLLSMGVSRVVMGTSALSSSFSSWLSTYGAEAIVLAVDFKIRNNVPQVAIQGWTQDTTKSVWEILDEYPAIQHVLCTDIGRDGMQYGPNHAFYQMLVQRYPTLLVQASGGVGTVQDLKQLKEMGVAGAIIGKAIYEQTLSLWEAIECLK